MLVALRVSSIRTSKLFSFSFLHLLQMWKGLKDWRAGREPHPFLRVMSSELVALLLRTTSEKSGFNNPSKYLWKASWKQGPDGSVEQVCFIALYLSSALYCSTVVQCLCVFVCTSLWLKLHFSCEPVPAGGLQSTLCHVRAAGSGLTRCPGSWRLCPAAYERRWHKACPAESAVCSLCLPFSFAQHFGPQREAVRGGIVASGGRGAVHVPPRPPPHPFTPDNREAYTSLVDGFKLVSHTDGRILSWILCK